MELAYHRLVANDIANAISRYREAGNHTEEKFLGELASAFVKLGDFPERYHFDRCGWRRFNLKDFPYHVLYVVELQAVRVMTIRHNHQNPTFGTKRR